MNSTTKRRDIGEHIPFAWTCAERHVERDVEPQKSPPVGPKSMRKTKKRGTEIARDEGVATSRARRKRRRDVAKHFLERDASIPRAHIPSRRQKQRIITRTRTACTNRPNFVHGVQTSLSSFPRPRPLPPRPLPPRSPPRPLRSPRSPPRPKPRENPPLSDASAIVLLVCDMWLVWKIFVRIFVSKKKRKNFRREKNTHKERERERERARKYRAATKAYIEERIRITR